VNVKDVMQSELQLVKLENIVKTWNNKFEGTVPMEKNKGCTGKKKYLIEEAAEVAILRMKLLKKHKKRQIKTLNSYKCKHCHFWHIGHNKYDEVPRLEFHESCCEGWDKPTGHPVEDKSVKYRKEAELYLCEGCFKEFSK